MRRNVCKRALNCHTSIVKYVQNWSWYSFNFSTLPLPALLCWRGCSQKASVSPVKTCPLPHFPIFLLQEFCLEHVTSKRFTFWCRRRQSGLSSGLQMRFHAGVCASPNKIELLCSQTSPNAREHRYRVTAVWLVLRPDSSQTDVQGKVFDTDAPCVCVWERETLRGIMIFITQLLGAGVNIISCHLEPPLWENAYGAA